MSQSEYGQFVQAQGHRVFEMQGALWAEKRKFFFESIPPHHRISVSKVALRRLFLKGAAAIRYTCDVNEGRPSFEYVCSDKDFSLNSLTPEARRRVRRGIESCEVREIEFEFLAKNACPINRNTLLRQHRAGLPWMTDETLWKRYMAACARIPSMQAFGAFVKDRFVGYSMSVIADDYSYLHHTQAFAEDLKYSPINVLTYFVTKQMLARPEIRHVSQGLEPFASLPDVERFKLAMGFEKRTLGRRVVLNPIVKPLFSRPSVWFARKTIGIVRPDLAEDFSTLTVAFRMRKAIPELAGGPQAT
jgi:hypothetical protein